MDAVRKLEGEVETMHGQEDRQTKGHGWNQKRHEEMRQIGRVLIRGRNVGTRIGAHADGTALAWSIWALRMGE